MKVALLFFVGFAAIDYLMAHEIDQRDHVIESRKHKPFHDIFLFMGGLQSLVTFVIIKMKIALIAATVIGAVALALKVFGFFKYSGYFFKNDYASIGLPLSEFHGYPLPPPPTEIDHDQHETYGNDWSSYSEHYARSGSVSETLPKSANLTEIVYSFMHVDKDDCRARLICEFETIMMRSSFFGYLIRHGIVERVLQKSDDQRENCSAHYTRCRESLKVPKSSLRKRRNQVRWIEIKRECKLQR